MANTLYGVNPKLRKALGSGVPNKELISVMNGAIGSEFDEPNYPRGEGAQVLIPSADMTGTRTKTIRLTTRHAAYGDSDTADTPLTWLEGMTGLSVVSSTASGTVSVTVNETPVTTDTDVAISGAELVVEITLGGTWAETDEWSLSLNSATIPYGFDVVAAFGQALPIYTEVVQA